MTEKIQTKLYLEEELKERLKAQAVKERRSVNNLLECIIIKYLDEQEHKSWYNQVRTESSRLKVKCSLRNVKS